MEVLRYNVKQNENKALIEFELTRNLEPEDLKSIKLPDPVKEGFSNKLVILSGRGPIWLYAFMVHHFHPCKAIAIYDPRLDGAIVVESHNKEFSIGEVVRYEL
ncbi:MAG: CRISPR-associated ring nuclease Crn3/Csx3 [Exilispira sp.]|jgi:CRISPR-associated protein Csx3|nr:CRISPR-associated ring nuclease Crn3/Csx3 [Exilispira sp.]